VPRPTRLEDGERGLAHWIKMFGRAFIADLDEGSRAALVSRVAQGLRPHLFCDDAWHADYVRLRVAARRPGS